MDDSLALDLCICTLGRENNMHTQDPPYYITNYISRVVLVKSQV